MKSVLEINKIHNMDCLDGLKLIPAGYIDLIVTDPPYLFKRGKDSKNNFFAKRHKKHLLNIADTFGHAFDPKPFLEEIPRVMKKMNAYIWTSKDNLPIYLNWAIEKGYTFNLLTWHKLNPMPLWNNTYRPDTEYCVYIREKGAYFNSKLRDKRKYKKYFLTKIGTAAETKNIPHPAPKPLITAKNPIEVSSKEGDIILDCYMGSGTTAIACKQLGRDFLGFEINPTYIKLAEQRLCQTTLSEVATIL